MNKNTASRFARYRPFLLITLALLILGTVAFFYSLNLLLNNGIKQAQTPPNPNLPLPGNSKQKVFNRTTADNTTWTEDIFDNDSTQIETLEPKTSPSTLSGTVHLDESNPSTPITSNTPHSLNTTKKTPYSINRENINQTHLNTGENNSQKTPASKPKITHSNLSSLSNSKEALREFTDIPYTNPVKAAEDVTTHLKNMGALGIQDLLKTSSTNARITSNPSSLELTQWHDNLLVLGGKVWITIENRSITSISGKTIKNIKVNSEPTLSLEAALTKAKQHELETFTQSFRQTLVIFRRQKTDHLGWMIEGQLNGRNETIILSAQDGHILFRQPTLSESDTPAQL